MAVRAAGPIVTFYLDAPEAARSVRVHGDQRQRQGGFVVQNKNTTSLQFKMLVLGFSGLQSARAPLECLKMFDMHRHSTHSWDFFPTFLGFFFAPQHFSPVDMWQLVNVTRWKLGCDGPNLEAVPVPPPPGLTQHR